MEQLGQKWLAENQINAPETTQMSAALLRLQSIYERHIAIEDNEIFPLARKVLDAAKLNEVGREMAKRRGQSWCKQGV